MPILACMQRVHEPAEAGRKDAAHGREREPVNTEPALFDSSLRSAADRALAHFAGRNANEPNGPEDRIELWGRRIGRALSLAACIGLGVYLYLTYAR